jgi:hypothetical protein
MPARFDESPGVNGPMIFHYSADERKLCIMAQNLFRMIASGALRVSIIRHFPLSQASAQRAQGMARQRLNHPLALARFETVGLGFVPAAAPLGATPLCSATAMGAAKSHLGPTVWRISSISSRP